ncbi:hypothetical protein PILCRDRAFT_86070 [Piloderma croceum F 1598]|uniref:Uncharacterized protein n=1 Tax=Piloderma croceum (strain F 1598) TaxID=765440 RepID=A0A0C3BKG3_PILCF|nr:hypothetical protein PILCRDRAFT_86070 [Piloderma croceum F 1598]
MVSVLFTSRKHKVVKKSRAVGRFKRGERRTLGYRQTVFDVYRTGRELYNMYLRTNVRLEIVQAVVEKPGRVTLHHSRNIPTHDIPVLRCAWRCERAVCEESDFRMGYAVTMNNISSTTFGALIFVY